jgi:hypothetical protein
MKKLSILLLVLAVVTCFVLSCKNNGGGDPAYVGTWVESYTGGSETITFTTSTMNVVDVGSLAGTMAASFKAVDEGAKHIQVAVTSGTGSVYGSIPAGFILYVTYNVTGSSLYVSISPTAYPATASMGPYTRQ